MVEPPFTTLISPERLAELLAEPSLRLLDCRFSLADPSAGSRAYAAAHLPGAAYVDLERDLSAPVIPGRTGRHPLPDPEAFAQKLGSLGIDDSLQVVVYDDASGAIAARAWWMLRWLGHDAVAVLDGGYPAWLANGGPTSDVLPEIAPRRFVAKVRDALLVDADTVARMAARSDHRVFDARAVERFTGEQENIDPRAGHIPGARSLPFADNLENGRFRSPAELRRRFEAALGLVASADAAVYCGSGVTACHDLLAAAHAGYRDLRLYAGSWSEWITDPSRGVATGHE